MDSLLSENMSKTGEPYIYIYELLFKNISLTTVIVTIVKKHLLYSLVI